MWSLISILLFLTMFFLQVLTSTSSSKTKNKKRNSDLATKTFVIEQLPEDVSTPAQFVVSSAFDGSIEFIEANEFRLELTAVAETSLELAHLEMSLIGQSEPDSILLLVNSRIPNTENELSYIATAIIALCIVSLIASIIYVKWWYVAKMPFLKAMESDVDSKAPLLHHQDSPMKNVLDHSQDLLEEPVDILLNSRTKWRKHDETWSNGHCYSLAPNSGVD